MKLLERIGTSAGIVMARGLVVLRTAGVLSLCVGTCWGAGPANAGDAGPQDTYTNVGVGQDPQAFADAARMYGMVQGDVCDAALADVTDAILGSQLPETDTVSRLLPRLNGCMARDDAQRAVARWAELAAGLVRARGGVGTPAGIETANTHYRGGDLEAAIPAYRRVLASAPGHLDARNNLGLALLHMGSDAAAQLHLEIAHDLDPAYVPALANLTALYERLGLRPRAVAASRAALEQQPAYPPAIYNAAWLAHEAGDYDRTADLLAQILPMNASPAHAQLHAINDKRHARQRAAVLLDESFDGAGRGWKVWTNGEHYDALFESGSYVVQTKNENCSSEAIALPHSLPADFDLELLSTWKSGVDNSAYGLTLGIDNDRRYHFGISGNGQTVVWDIEPGSKDPCPWQRDTAVVGTGDTINRQVVQVRGGNLQYLVNGHPIVAFTNRYKPGAGVPWSVGVRVCGKERVAFDRLRVIGLH